MMVLFFVLILLFLILIYLLLAPVILYVNTINNQYYLKYQGLMKASILSDEKEVFKVKLNILFMKFYFYPLRKAKLTSTKNNLKNNRKKERKQMSLRKGLKLLKSFKIKRFLINIDTGDCIANAKLYPIFAFLNYKFGGFYINFDGRNQLVFHLYNRPIDIIKAFIKN